MESAEPGAGAEFTKSPRRPRDEIVFHYAAASSARTLDGKAERFPGRQGYRVASAGERDETLECVPPVGAPAGYAQGKIDFRGRAFGENLRQNGRLNSQANERPRKEKKSFAVFDPNISLCGACCHSAMRRARLRKHDQPPFFFPSACAAAGLGSSSRPCSILC